jgi:hypothetical protein
MEMKSKQVSKVDCKVSPNGSGYFDKKTLGASAVVLKYDSNGFDPRLEEQIVVKSSSGLLGLLNKFGGIARGRRWQRTQKKERADGFMRQIKAGTMCQFDVHLLVDPSCECPTLLVGHPDGERGLLTADGLHKVESAIMTNWEGMLNIRIWVVGNADVARTFLSRFDSKVAARSSNDIAGYAFDDYPELSTSLIRLVNGPMSSLHESANGKAWDQVDVEFARGKAIAGIEDFMRLRDQYMDILLWYRDNVHDYDKACDTKRQMHVGVRTAIIQSMLVDGGEKAMSVWNVFFSPTDTKSCEGRLRDYIRDHSGTGQDGQTEEYNISVFTYLAATEKFNLSRESKYKKSKRYTFHGIFARAEMKKTTGPKSGK